MTKTCNVCNISKALGEFYKGHNQCKACVKIKATCEHNRAQSQCKECVGGHLCEHKKRRSYWQECGGSQICEHKKDRSNCKECGGSQICEHKRQRSRCKECGGGSICEHKKRRSQCKECGGGSICEHKKRRAWCKECGGSQIYEHQKDRSTCKECGGGAICEHKKVRSKCPTCSPNSNAFCHGCPQTTFVLKRNNYLCQYCRPDGSARQRTREYQVKAFLENSGYKFIHNRAVNTSNTCRAFRPDFLFDCGTFYLIAECDEDAHRNSNYTYEEERQREYAIRDFLDRPCVFIRFNPDRCLGSDGKNIDIRKRYPVLKRTIDFYLDNGFDGMDVFVEYLYY